MLRWILRARLMKRSNHVYFIFFRIIFFFPEINFSVKKKKERKKKFSTIFIQIIQNHNILIIYIMYI